MADVLDPEELAWAQQVAPSPREEKEHFIYELMLRMRWYGPESVRRLSEVWNMGQRTVHAYSKKARERFREALADPEELRSRFIENLEFIAADALRKRKAIMDREGIIHLAPAPDHAAAIRGLTAAADLAGLKQAQKEQAQEEPEKKYGDKEVGELLELARKRGILSPAPPPATEILTTGEESNGVERSSNALPDQARGDLDGSQRIRGRSARRNQDPVGERDHLGRAKPGAEPRPHPDGLRLYGRVVSGEAGPGAPTEGDEE